MVLPGFSSYIRQPASRRHYAALISECMKDTVEFGISASLSGSSKYYDIYCSGQATIGQSKNNSKLHILLFGK